MAAAVDALFSPAELAELPQQEPIEGEPQIGALIRDVIWGSPMRLLERVATS